MIPCMAYWFTMYLASQKTVSLVGFDRAVPPFGYDAKKSEDNQDDMRHACRVTTVTI